MKARRSQLEARTGSHEAPPRPTYKSAIDELAVFGHKPAFPEGLFVNRPNLKNRQGFIDRLDQMLDRRWFTNDGPLVTELEQELADYLRVRHCVVACSGTAALQLLIRALELDGEVILPSFGFISVPHALQWLGLKPVFCDIEPDGWNIDPGACESLVTPQTSAIIGVHMWGQPCQTQRLGRIAADHGLKLLFDAAHAFGCANEGSMVGSFGDAEVFSFHATKVLQTLEGGAVTTDDDELAERLRLMRNFGFSGYDRVTLVGMNAKMPESSAAMGLANLEVFDTVLAANKRCYEAYREGLHDIPGLAVLQYHDDAVHNRQYVVLEVSERESGLTRDHLIRVLHAENIFARRYFFPGCHRMEPYVSAAPEVDSRLPNTNRATERVLILPAGAGVELDHVQEVCELLRLSVRNATTLRTRLHLNGELQSDPGPIQSRLAPASIPLARTVNATPTLEIRIPISPDPSNMRMLHYLLASLQKFGGPIGCAAHCVASVGADREPRNLESEYPWTRDYSLEFRWVDRDSFRRQSYDATGWDRFSIGSDADVVLLLDADILIAGDFDRVIVQSHRYQRMLGFIAHVSPFATLEFAQIPGNRWWDDIFKNAGLPKPQLAWEHTGWNLDWEAIAPRMRIKENPSHRHCPPYYNYGFVMGPRKFIERMGETFEADFESVSRLVTSDFNSQITNCVTFARHGMPCGTTSINYNFPLSLPGDQMRALNPDPRGEDRDEDIKIFHYIGGRKHFASEETVQALLNQAHLPSPWPVFQRTLRSVHDTIAAKQVAPPLRAALSDRAGVPLRTTAKRLRSLYRRLKNRMRL